MAYPSKGEPPPEIRAQLEAEELRKKFKQKKPPASKDSSKIVEDTIPQQSSDSLEVKNQYSSKFGDVELNKRLNLPADALIEYLLPQTGHKLIRNDLTPVTVILENDDVAMEFNVMDFAESDLYYVLILDKNEFRTHPKRQNKFKLTIQTTPEKTDDVVYIGAPAYLDKFDSSFLMLIKDVLPS